MVCIILSRRGTGLVALSQTPRAGYSSHARWFSQRLATAACALPYATHGAAYRHSPGGSGTCPDDTASHQSIIHRGTRRFAEQTRCKHNVAGERTPEQVSLSVVVPHDNVAQAVAFDMLFRVARRVAFTPILAISHMPTRLLTRIYAC